jgi:hypothetical protein
VYYLLYEITNLVNGKTYIGQHITKYVNDGYMGSGKAIVKAIKKYGKENFKKEILLYAKNEVALNFFERALVTPEFCELDTNYNLREGGNNGGKLSSKVITKRQETRRKNGNNYECSPETRVKLSLVNKGRSKSSEHMAKVWEARRKNGTDKPTPEQRLKMSLAHKGKKQSPETIAKRALANRGKKLSPETIAKREETRRRNKEAKLALHA